MFRRTLLASVGSVAGAMGASLFNRNGPPDGVPVDEPPPDDPPPPEPPGRDADPRTDITAEGNADAG